MFTENGEALVECPYDASHVVANKSLNMHLIRCRENHKSHKKVACKFDKTHVVPLPELPHHLSVCTGRYLLDREFQSIACTGVGGILSGAVKGPQILSQHADIEDEDWDAEPAFEAPIAFFNRKEINKLEQIPPPQEMTCRKLPHTPSKAATISEPTRHQAPNVSEVYLFSLAQTSNKGWGRGRGMAQKQINVGSDQPHVSGSQSEEKLARGRGVFPSSDRLRLPTRSSHAQAICSQPNLERTETQGDEVYKKEVNENADSNNFYGKKFNEPSNNRSSEMALDDSCQLSREESHHHNKQSSSLFQQNGLHVKDSDFRDDDHSSDNKEELLKTKRKLMKKLKQIITLEQKLNKGVKLTEEEKMKLEKKNETVFLVDKLNALL